MHMYKKRFEWHLQWRWAQSYNKLANMKKETDSKFIIIDTIDLIE